MEVYMPKRRKKTPTPFGKIKQKTGANQAHVAIEDYLKLHTQFTQFKKQSDKLEKALEESQDRLQDAEIHVNLLTRLLTTLCIEKFGMRIGVLKRIIKRIEKEAIRDSQIMHLESLYKLPHAK